MAAYEFFEETNKEYLELVVTPYMSGYLTQQLTTIHEDLDVIRQYPGLYLGYLVCYLSSTFGITVGQAARKYDELYDLAVTSKSKLRPETDEIERQRKLLENMWKNFQ